MNEDFLSSDGSDKVQTSEGEEEEKELVRSGKSRDEERDRENKVFY